MNRKMKSVLFSLAAPQAPLYNKVDIYASLKEHFGELACQPFSAEVHQYLQSLRELYVSPERRPQCKASPTTISESWKRNNIEAISCDVKRHNKVCAFICRVSHSEPDINYHAVRSAVKQNYGSVTFNFFKSRIINLLKSLDALTTNHYNGRLLLCVRSIKRNDKQRQYGCKLQLIHGSERAIILEKAVGDTGIFVAFPAGRFSKDDFLHLHIFPKCKNVFHSKIQCKCVTYFTSKRISLTQVYSNSCGEALDEWFDCGANVTIRLQMFFHYDTLNVANYWENENENSKQFCSNSSKMSSSSNSNINDSCSSSCSSSSSSCCCCNGSSNSSCMKNMYATHNRPTNLQDNVKISDSVKSASTTHRASGYLEKILVQALNRLYSHHVPESNIEKTRFQFDKGRAAQQLQSNRRRSTVVHMSSLISIMQKKQAARWSARGGLTNLPKSEGQSRKWLEASKENRALVWQGVPTAMRAQLYLRISGTENIMKAHSPDYYNSLVAHPELAPKKFAVVIDRDVPRTFGGMNHRGMTLQHLQDILKRVLYAYASRNQVLGYCQSMNFLVAYFLLHLLADERTAFWLLVACVERLAPGYYVSTMEGLRAEFNILRICATKRFPKLMLHMSNIHASFESMVTGPLLCFFVVNVPMETAARLMDVAFFVGTDLYLATLCAIMRLGVKALLEQTNVVTFSSMLKLAQVQQIDSNSFMELVFSEFYMGYHDVALPIHIYTAAEIGSDDLRKGESFNSLSLLPSQTIAGDRTELSAPSLVFYNGSTDAVHRNNSYLLSCGASDAQRQRKSCAILQTLFPLLHLSFFNKSDAIKLHTQLSRPCVLFFQVLAQCRAFTVLGEQREWRRSPAILAIRDWSVQATGSPGNDPVRYSTKIPTSPMYIQYLTLYHLDYWCVTSPEGSEWNNLLHRSQATVYDRDPKIIRRQIFDAFDLNGDGVINVYEYVLGVALLGLYDVETRPTANINCHDNDDDLSVNQKLQLAFLIFDTNNSGYITGLQFQMLIQYIRKLLSCRKDWASLQDCPKEHAYKSKSNQNRQNSTNNQSVEFLAKTSTFQAKLQLEDGGQSEEELHQERARKDDESDIRVPFGTDSDEAIQSWFDLMFESDACDANCSTMTNGKDDDKTDNKVSNWKTKYFDIATIIRYVKSCAPILLALNKSS